MPAPEREQIVDKTRELLSSEGALRRFVEWLVNSLTTEELAQLARSIETAGKVEDGEQQIAQLLGVREYANEERKGIALSGLIQYFNYRRKLLSDALTAPQVAELIGKTRQTPHDRLKAGLLLGVMDNGVWKFPAWQFDADGPNGVVDGFPEVLAALHLSPISKISWLSIPNAVFEGRSPIEVLRKGGHKEEVIHEASAVGAS